VAYDLPGTASARILWGTGRGSYQRTGALGIRDCAADFDEDGDIDGSDLATFTPGGAGISLKEFAGDFGRTDCPVSE
jgi:hypothetical protein